MANTIVKSGETLITIDAMDSDWSWSDLNGVTSDNWVRLKWIRFNPGAASERLVMFDGAVSGAELFDSGVAADTGDVSIQYYHDELHKPIVDFSACVLNNANSRVTICISKT